MILWKVFLIEQIKKLLGNVERFGFLKKEKGFDGIEPKQSIDT